MPRKRKPRAPAPPDYDLLLALLYRLVSPLKSIPVQATDSVVYIRPEDVALALVDPSGAIRPPASSVRNRWPGVVDSLIPAGPLVRVVVRLDGDEGIEPLYGGEGEVISLITRASAEELSLAPGMPVIASAKAAALHVLRG